MLIDCEDMSFDAQSKLINSYRGEFPMYSDACECGAVLARLVCFLDYFFRRAALAPARRCSSCAPPPYGPPAAAPHAFPQPTACLLLPTACLPAAAPLALPRLTACLPTCR